MNISAQSGEPLGEADARLIMEAEHRLPLWQQRVVVCHRCRGLVVFRANFRAGEAYPCRCGHVIRRCGRPMLPDEARETDRLLGEDFTSRYDNND